MVIEFTDELLQDINKLVGTLKPEEQLREVLKKKLTKKELKYYKMKIEGASEKKMCSELQCDEERLDELHRQTILKLNQEKIKKELVIHA